MQADVRASDGTKLEGGLFLLDRRRGSAQGEREYLILGEEAVLVVHLRPSEANQGGRNQEDCAFEGTENSLFHVSMNAVEEAEKHEIPEEARVEDDRCEPVEYDRRPTDHAHAAGLATQLLSVEKQQDGSLLAKIAFLVFPDTKRGVKRNGSTFTLNVVQCLPIARSEAGHSASHNLEETKMDEMRYATGNGKFTAESMECRDDTLEGKSSFSMEEFMSSMGRSFAVGPKVLSPVRYWQTKVHVFNPLCIKSTQIEIQLETIVALKVRNTLPSYLGPEGVIDLADIRFEHQPENPSVPPLQITAIPQHHTGVALPALHPGEEFSLAYKPIVVKESGTKTPEQEGKYFAVVTCGNFKHQDDFIYRQILHWRPRDMQGIVLSARLVGLTDTTLGVQQTKPVSVALQVTNLSKKDVNIELLFATPTENDNPCKSLLWLQSKRPLGKVAQEDASFTLVEMLPLHEGTITLEGIKLKDLTDGTIYAPITLPQIFIRSSK
uniref:Trafficking protein particle complex subunit 13 C-terminal domain-containing protein n=1 Tax=Picocystis salinarum TaxID=88271 RepID=A0A6U9RSC6_9CHLO